VPVFRPKVQSGELAARASGGYILDSRPTEMILPSLALALLLADGGAPAAATVAPRPPMAPDVRQLVDRMQAFYEKTDDFSATFRQDYTYKAFKRTQTSTGTVVFKKPGLMRWEYEKPSRKTFILAGEKVYAYDPEAMTLTKASINTHQLSASVTFLWGKGKLADEFDITRADCKTCAGPLLVLDPVKPDPRFKQVRLEVDPKTAQVLRSTVIDPDGSENAIQFIGLKTNTGVGPERFKLNPPDGTQIVDMTKPKP
jgi:outer membrane lipoprotein carrier protein